LRLPFFFFFPYSLQKPIGRNKHWQLSISMFPVHCHLR
jgi:hypothetical protein